MTTRAVDYQQYTAKVSDAGGFQFLVDCPHDQLLDAEAYIEYTVQFVVQSPFSPVEFGGQWEGSVTPVGEGSSAFDEGHELGPRYPSEQFFTAFRQGFTMTHAMSSATLFLNEEKVTQRPSEYVAVMERFYARPDELRNICSMSGGELDSGNFSNLMLDNARMFSVSAGFDFGAGETLHLNVQPGFEKSVYGPAVNPNTANIHATFPRYKDWYNPGLTRRWHKMARDARYAGADPDAVFVSGESRYGTGTTAIKLTERIPFAPFMTWASRDRQQSIPNLRRIDMQVKWASDAVNRILQGRNDGRIGTAIIVDYYTVKPILHLRWNVPVKPGPPRVSIPWTYYYSHPSPTFTIEQGEDEFTSEQVVKFTIRMRSWPKKLFIYAAPVAGDLEISTEHHLELVNLELAIDASSGKLIRLSSQQMFALYIKNSPTSLAREFDYNEWRKYYCALCLSKNDIGWDYDDADGKNITVTATVRSHWNAPTVGFESNTLQDANRDYRLFMQGEYGYKMLMDKKQCQLVRV